MSGLDSAVAVSPSSPPLRTSRPTVLVFGSVGSGKSSLINMLPHDETQAKADAPTGRTPTNVTTEIKTYPKVVNTRQLSILEAVGTSEPHGPVAKSTRAKQAGASNGGRPSGACIPTIPAMKKLHDHLVDDQVRVGLIVIVVRGVGRVTPLDESNYRLCRLLFGDNVPIVLAITHLDHAEDKDRWWHEQHRGGLALLKSVGLVSSPGPGDVFREDYQRSVKDLMRLIDESLLAEEKLAIALSIQHHASQNVPRPLALPRTLTFTRPILLPITHPIQRAVKRIENKPVDSDAKWVKDMQKHSAHHTLPVVVFVGPRNEITSKVVGMLEDADSPVVPQFDTQRVQQFVKTMNGQPVRVVQTPAIGDLDSPDNPSTIPSNNIQALHDSLLQAAFGLRLVVLVAEGTKSRLTLKDTNHHGLIKRLGGKNVPICLITTRAESIDSDSPQGALGKQRTSFKKHIRLSIDPRGASHAESKADLATTLDNFISSKKDYQLDQKKPPNVDMLEDILRELGQKQPEGADEGFDVRLSRIIKAKRLPQREQTLLEDEPPLLNLLPPTYLTSPHEHATSPIDVSSPTSIIVPANPPTVPIISPPIPPGAATDDVPTILAFGTTGAGKSSVINMLPLDPRYPNEPPAKSASSCAGKTTQISQHHRLVNDRRVVVLDTVGTWEIETGTTPTHRAIEELHKAVVALPTGVNLVMIVKSAGRVTAQDQCNYELARFLFGDEVPIVLVFTHLEAEQEPKAWWESHAGKRGKLALLEGLGVVSFKGPESRNYPFKDLYEQSIQDLSKFLEQSLAPGPGVKVTSKPRTNFLVSAFRRFASWVARRPGQAQVNQRTLRHILQDFHINNKHIRRLTKVIKVKPPLPAIVLVGASDKTNGAIVDLLTSGSGQPLGSTHLPAAPTTSRAKNFFGSIDGQRVRILQTIKIASTQPPESPSPAQAVTMLYESLTAHLAGIRLVVLVVQTNAEGQLNTAAHNHYCLVRRFCGEDVPVCVVEIPSDTPPQDVSGDGNGQSAWKPDKNAFEKHVRLSPGIEGNFASSESAAAFRKAVAGLVRSGVDCDALGTALGALPQRMASIAVQSANAKDFDQRLGRLLEDGETHDDG